MVTMAVGVPLKPRNRTAELMMVVLVK